MGRVAEDDERAFTELVRRFQGRVGNLISRVLNDRENTDDLAQEVFVRVFVHRRNYRRGAKFSTWVFTIARNLRVDRLRREVVWFELDVEHAELPEDGPLPDEQVNSHEIQRQVRLILDGMPKDQVEVVMMSYVEGLSHSEIAERTGLPLGTVKSRMRLAYQKVREALEDLT